MFVVLFAIAAGVVASVVVGLLMVNGAGWCLLYMFVGPLVCQRLSLIEVAASSRVGDSDPVTEPFMIPVVSEGVSASVGMAPTIVSVARVNR